MVADGVVNNGIFAMEIKGMDAEAKRFNAMAADFQIASVGEIINYALEQVEVEAKSKAPVRTGFLRDHISHFMYNEASGTCIAQAPYSAAQEFGYVTPTGAHIPGKNFFMPAAMHGRTTLITELNKYMASVISGQGAKVPRGGKRFGSTAAGHKYISRQNTGAGVRYVYAKTTQPTRRHFQGRPGVRKEPTTSGHRRRPGGGLYRR